MLSKNSDGVTFLLNFCGSYGLDFVVLRIPVEYLLKMMEYTNFRWLRFNMSSFILSVYSLFLFFAV